MTSTQVTTPGWHRGVEDLYPGNNDASLSWGSYDKTTNGDFLSGHVVTIKAGTGNEVAKATGGAFRGIMFTENSSELDESLGKSVPSVIVGNTLLRIFRRSLKAGHPYAPGEYVTSGTGADAGLLVNVTRDASNVITTPTNAIVGFVQEVTDGWITVRVRVQTI